MANEPVDLNNNESVFKHMDELCREFLRFNSLSTDDLLAERRKYVDIIDKASGMGMMIDRVIKGRSCGHPLTEEEIRKATEDGKKDWEKTHGK